jgi:hypothetical protein
MHEVVLHDPKELAKLSELRQPRRDVTSDTSTWWTRNESASFLSLSTQTLKNYEHDGKLHPLRVPRQDARGHEQVVVVYDPKELAKLPRGAGKFFAPQGPGELNASAYTLFEAGKSISQIVIELRQPSDTIHDLHAKWIDDGGADIVISPEARKALEILVGPFKDVTELVELVTEKLKVEVVQEEST